MGIQATRKPASCARIEDFHLGFETPAARPDRWCTPAPSAEQPIPALIIWHGLPQGPLQQARAGPIAPSADAGHLFERALPNDDVASIGLVRRHEAGDLVGVVLSVRVQRNNCRQVLFHGVVKAGV